MSGYVLKCIILLLLFFGLDWLEIFERYISVLVSWSIVSVLDSWHEIKRFKGYRETFRRFCGIFDLFSLAFWAFGVSTFVYFVVFCFFSPITAAISFGLVFGFLLIHPLNAFLNWYNSTTISFYRRYAEFVALFFTFGIIGIFYGGIAFIFLFPLFTPVGGIIFIIFVVSYLCPFTCACGKCKDKMSQSEECIYQEKVNEVRRRYGGFVPYGMMPQR